MKELDSIKNTYTLYPKTYLNDVFFFGLIRPLPLIVSLDALRSKLPPQWLIFLFILTEFFVAYPELRDVTLNLCMWENRRNN
jgi:hypothetical protein